MLKQQCLQVMDNTDMDDVLDRILAGSEDPKHLPFRVLEKITNGFSAHRNIGSGGFGVVYKGVVTNGHVAVKRIDLNIYTVDDTMFIREVTNLLKVNHPNVVRFLGFCSYTEMIKGEDPEVSLLADVRERLLCFEYMSNGSLDKHITDELRGLEWNTRYQIIKGICEGLRYLHVEKRIIHMDLKPANIMVDSDMMPKITDFGLSRPDEKSHTVNRFASRGYCAPEYIEMGKTKFTCDIYSLGVIIGELVTGRKGSPRINKVKVVRRWKSRWKELVTHPSLEEQQVIKCMEIAERCMAKAPEHRLSICDVIGNLQEIGTMNEGVSATGQASLSSGDDIMWIEPVELHFAFESNKEISWLVELKNVTGNYIAFNIDTLSELLQCCTEPKQGVVQPQSQRTVKITLRVQDSTLPDIHRPVDALILKSVKVKEAIEDKHVTDHMFEKKAGKVVDKVKLRVVYEETKRPQDVPPNPEDDIGSSSNRDAREQHTTRLIFNPPQFISIATNLRYQCDKAHPQAAVDVVTGAMGSLLPKLRELLKQERMLPRSMKKDLEFLERHLRKMQAALRKMLSLAQQDQLDPQDKDWACDVRELSYDIEDVVDDLLLRINITSLEGSEPFSNNTNHDDYFVQLKEAIEDIMDRVKEVAPWKVTDFVAAACGGVDDDPRLLALYKHHKDSLVGIHGPRDGLAKRLLTGVDGGASKQQLKIVSIFGPGGLGKTTLAKEVYDMLRAEFNLNAFVSVGRNPDMKEVLGGILLRLNKEKYSDIHNRRWKRENLIDELQDLLKYKRYLIVIDDIWDIASWEIIKQALIDNHKGSKIITTSRSFEVAKSSGEVCELKPLSDDHSKELFNARLFGPKGTCTFDPADEQFRKVLRKCGGVPLAIITLASLLACKPREDWAKVCSSIGFGNEDDIYGVVENTRKILLFSYYDLPCYLKTCLLYLSIFPEDHEIEKDTLIWKWVGEGFVHEEPGKALFKIGERYFNELINRSMIQPVGGKSDSYSIHACHVHDMVLDMICSVAKEENFVSILDSYDDQNLCSEWNVRRLAVHKGVVEQHDLENITASTSKPKLRSFNATRCRLSMMPILARFQVLRVLSFEGCTCTCPSDIKNNLAGLLHLRYLGLFGTPDCELPMEIGDLRCLQTLDLRKAGVEVLPQSLIQLRQLKCLRSEDRTRRLPDGMGNLTCLEDLRLHEVAESPSFVKELGKLTELRVLHINTSSFSDNLNKTLVESLSALQKIEELELNGGGSCNWTGFSPSRRLRHLLLENISNSRRLPVWLDPTSIPNLNTLTVAMESVEERDLDILGSFTELRYLCLRWSVGEHKVFPNAIAAGAFPKLRYCDVPFSLNYQQGAMPCLEALKFGVIVFPEANKDLDFDSMRYLRSLQKVDVAITRWNVTVSQVDAAGAAVRRAVGIHPNRPILVLDDLIGVCTDEYPVLDGFPAWFRKQYTPGPNMSPVRRDYLLNYTTRAPSSFLD